MVHGVSPEESPGGSPGRPDRIIFDLDPEEGLPWARVVAGAREVKDRLGLHGFVKTTGGTGLHVVALLERPYD